jgi:threonine dehydrogenase-like Zn-dependent dehydrogenase
MPRELIVEAPGRIGYREYTEPDLGPNQVLVETRVSGIKHGTEMNAYRGTLPFAGKIWDGELRLFRAPDSAEAQRAWYPQPLGSWAAGVVRAVGAAVTRWKPGDWVHGGWPHRESVVRPEDGLYPVPEGVPAEVLVFTDPACFALAAVHDAAIKLGDDVAVFGMGAIGLLAAQMARLNGAARVIVVDPMPDRLSLALDLGADEAVNPAEVDAGLTIKRGTAGRGVDVAIEVSGAYAALQEALRSVQREGRVVAASFYGSRPEALDLAAEWHHNRITLLSSMPVWGNTHRSHPLWDLERIRRTAMRLLAAGHLQVQLLIGARVPFERAAEAYVMIDRAAAGLVKVLLTYE